MKISVYGQTLKVKRYAFNKDMSLYKLLPLYPTILNHKGSNARVRDDQWIDNW